ncbi:DcrB-related protein [Fibrella sp. WM1]|uniref:DcrB-related protein n=1 Tax=Fibrella musci TaxID=3242485 RepID=UPI0035210153
MIYRMNEASIEIPDGWHEQTLHIFSSEGPGKAGHSLVMTAEPLPPGKTLDAYKAMALTRLPHELPGFRLLQDLPANIQGRIPAVVLESQWEQEGSIMHVFQALFVVTTGSAKQPIKGYSLTMTVPELLYTEQSQLLFAQILRSYQFDR